MNNNLNILCLGLFSLVIFSLQSNPIVHISITIEGAQDEIAVQELLEQALKGMHDICDATSCEVQINLKQDVVQSDIEYDTESQEVIEQALHKNVQSFVDACNTYAYKEGHTVTFHIENQQDKLTIVISCKEESPKQGYWQSVKNTVHSAKESVATKAKNAGGFIKGTAHTVKEKTKKGIHTVAEKVSEITQ